MNNHYQKADAAHKKALAIQEKAKAESRDLSVEEVGQVKTLMDEYKAEKKAGRDYEAALADLATAGDELNAGLESRQPDLSGASTPPKASGDNDASEPNLFKDRQFGFKNASHFIHDVMMAEVNPRKVSANMGRVERAFDEIKAASGAATFSGSDGGFFVPPQYSDQIYSQMTEVLPILGQAVKFYTKGNTWLLRGLKDHDRSSASYRYAGIVVYNVDEGSQITSSKLKTKLNRYDLHKKAALAYVTQEELDEIINFGQITLDKMAEAIADEIVEDMLWGNGAGVAMGAFQASSCIEQAKESSQVASTLQYINLAKMYARMDPKGYGKMITLVNQEVLPYLMTLDLKVGTGGRPVFMPPGGLADKPYGTLFGRPLIATDHMPAFASAGDVGMADFSQYAVATKGAMVPQVAISMHFKFDTDEQAIRNTFSIDGRPIHETALTPRKGTATIGSFVKLAARA